MRKVVFLDIDGVLNSVKYDRERRHNEGNIDESRMVLLRQLVDVTAAEIVLSSTWRKHWSQDKNEIDEIGKEIDSLFGKYGLLIADKTPILRSHDRAQEIREWLTLYKQDIDAFVIFDDEFSGWGDLSEHLVRTDPRIGRGLEEKHIQKAIELLTCKQ